MIDLRDRGPPPPRETTKSAADIQFPHPVGKGNKGPRLRIPLGRFSERMVLLALFYPGQLTQ